MSRKVPPDALTYYMSLGPQRSYQVVADHYQVSKRSIVSVAMKERWQQRIVELEQRAREGAEKKVGESLEEMAARHIRMLHVIAGKALETLKALPLDSAIDAVRSLAIVIREERAVRGDPNDQSETSIEDVIKREYQRWLKPAEGDNAKTVGASDGGQ